jgi:hypothetical protein
MMASCVPVRNRRRSRERTLKPVVSYAQAGHLGPIKTEALDFLPRLCRRCAGDLPTGSRIPVVETGDLTRSVSESHTRKTPTSVPVVETAPLIVPRDRHKGLRALARPG